MVEIWKGDFQTGEEVYQRLAITQRTKPPKEDGLTNLELFLKQREHRRITSGIRHSLLLPINEDFQINLPRAPDLIRECEHAIQIRKPYLISFRDLQEIRSAYLIKERGVLVKDLDDAKIHPHYGVFWPARSDYTSLLLQPALVRNILLLRLLGTDLYITL